MISARNVGRLPTGMSLVSDDVVEFHAARLILLLYICGTEESNNRRRIDGLTKIAKLDFFVRYPSFFIRAAEVLDKSTSIEDTEPDSKMIRYHYGPWDQRYYHVIPFMEARSLINVVKDPGKNQYKFYLTPDGISLAKVLLDLHEFDELKARMLEVKRVLGRKNGHQLKELVYKLFQKEVGDLSLGEIID
ncbi:hypothetical protein SAMN05421823_104510 [Catalinimonas alkaloidigena]|uniref:Uncharacterized protein n=1 Tax=Catalinimonas alkaloidigena TaxID=1075417 RepID=A0A1G9HQR1_9BACT|nr:hypothetical protein [Catalinimonas alkaloidigena]SDL15331.1 hypothetical protein SAMN05421823_104510 [Catalinimonas alkaloidigena]